MYKLKYYGLSKEEKSKLKEDFYKTDWGKNIKKRLNRLLFTGILGVIFSIIMFIVRKELWELVLSISLFIASGIFIFGSFKVRIKKLNEYLVKKNKR